MCLFFFHVGDRGSFSMSVFSAAFMRLRCLIIRLRQQRKRRVLKHVYPGDNNRPLYL